MPSAIMTMVFLYPETEMMTMKVLMPVKAIEAYCNECGGGMTKEVKLRPIEKCPLYPYRTGKRPKLDINTVLTL